jgi:hypothetical protein
MPHVLNDIDILEHPALECDERHTLPLVLPTPRRERSRFLALFRRLFSPRRRSRTYQEGYAPSASRFQTPLDILAQEHPDLYLRILSGLG